MQLFIGADHRGFNLKNKLIDYLQSNNIRIEDMGNYQNDPLDDAPFFSEKVAKAVQQNPEEHMGIVICGSGVAVSIMMNRHINIRCALALNQEHIKAAREHNHINGLALGSDYIDFDSASKIVDTFLFTPKNNQEKYIQRIKMLDFDTSKA